MDAGTQTPYATVSAYLTSIGITSLDYTLVSHMDANRYCCGNGTCESVGKDSNTCPIDC